MDSGRDEELGLCLLVIILRNHDLILEVEYPGPAQKNQNFEGETPLNIIPSYYSSGNDGMDLFSQNKSGS